jgi:hypothetical protein
MAGGRLEDSVIVRGEVFTNQVIRTGMPMTLTNAKILLVQDSISFHRLVKEGPATYFRLDIF